jgi:hypothetical protein
LAFEPLDVQLADGRLTLTPRINVAAAQPVLLLERGPLLNRVGLSAEMCRGWIKYVAPLLADAAQAEGRFSLKLDNAAVPLTTPEASEVEGVMSIHEARVGPGPLSQEFLIIARQIKAIVEKRPFGALRGAAAGPWLTLPAQEVAFRMAERRVHHRGLELAVGDVIIRTHGAVGLDQSLALVAEIPIRDEWVESDRLLSSLKGQVLRVPIRGALSRPAIDRRALEDLAGRVLSGAATRLFEDELNRGLQRLLGP